MAIGYWILQGFCIPEQLPIMQNIDSLSSQKKQTGHAGMKFWQQKENYAGPWLAVPKPAVWGCLQAETVALVALRIGICKGCSLSKIPLKQQC